MDLLSLVLAAGVLVEETWLEHVMSLDRMFEQARWHVTSLLLGCRTDSLARDVELLLQLMPGVSDLG